MRICVLRQLLAKFLADRVGSINISFAIALPVMIGAAGLAVDVGYWFTRQQTMQGAADSSAMSAVVAGGQSVEAEAVASSYGFVQGEDGAKIVVNKPPTSGTHTTNTGAVEVVITQPAKPYFASLFLDTAIDITARAVALANTAPCVLALNATANAAASLQGTTTVNLTGCSLVVNSNHATALSAGGSSQLSAESVAVVGGESGADHITTTMGNMTGAAPASDPYASVPMGSFSGCNQNKYDAIGVVTINPGVYCNGIKVNAGAVLTLNPGVYYIDRGCFCINGGATVRGTGVTLIFTSSTGKDYATMSINGGAIVELSAPTSGATAGIVLFGDRNMPAGTDFKLNGGSTQSFSGVVYLPKAAVTFAGGAVTGSKRCTQLVADTLTFTGNSNFALQCETSGLKTAGGAASLVE